MSITEAKPKRVRKAKPVDAPIEYTAYKGFDANLQCRGYQYAVGETYIHTGAAKQCGSGFHVCQNPLDVLDFYGLENGNRFAKVTVRGEVDRSDNKKWAAAELSVIVELKLPDLIADAITGAKSVAATVGQGSLVKAVAGTPIAICEYYIGGEPIGFATGIAGVDGVPADTWLIAKGGKLVAS